MIKQIGFFIFVIVIWCSLAFSETSAISSQHQVTINFPGLLTTSYDESIDRQGFAFDESRYFPDISNDEYDVRFSSQIWKYLDLGVGVNFRNYDSTVQAGFISSIEVDHGETDVLALTGFVRLKRPSRWIAPYISVGGGYAHLSVKDEITTTWRLTSEVFQARRQHELNKFAFQLQGGVQFVVSRHWLVGSEVGYFAIPAQLNSFGWGVFTGVAW